MEGAKFDGPGQALTDFHPFPRLPVELRDSIWDLALHDYPPQVITIALVRVQVTKVFDPTDGNTPSGSITWETDKCWAMYHIPCLLHVSIQARERALLVYPPSFEQCFVMPMYFDTRRDTLLFDDSYTLKIFKYSKLSVASLKLMAEVRHLALGKIVLEYREICFDREFLARFETLSSLLLERGNSGGYFQQSDSKERTAITWLSECWMKEGSSAEATGGGDGGLVGNAGPSIRFMDRQEIRALTTGRFSVKG